MKASQASRCACSELNSCSSPSSEGIDRLCSGCSLTSRQDGSTSSSSYKIDRLTRSLTDFANIVEILDTKGASFDVSVTQQFNTTGSMGRLTLNVLLSFAQFEREVMGERIRDRPSPRLASVLN